MEFFPDMAGGRFRFRKGMQGRVGETGRETAYFSSLAYPLCYLERIAEDRFFNEAS